MRMNKTLQYYFAYQFIKLLTKDFTKWEAYEMGLIDQDGNKLRDAKNEAEKEFLSPFYNLVRKTKRLVAKIPGGRSLIGSVIAAGLLLREELNLDQSIVENLLEEMRNHPDFSDINFDNYLREDHSRDVLTKGVYKTMPGSESLYGDQIFYVTESTHPIFSDHGAEIYSLSNPLGQNVLISFDHLIRVR